MGPFDGEDEGRRTSEGREDESASVEERPPLADEEASPPMGVRVPPPEGGGFGVALFVLFVISLSSFGKAPLAGMFGSEGSRVDFDLLSSVGVVGGLLAVVFLIGRRRHVASPGSAKRILGLIGAVGLIFHTAIALVAPLSYGGSGPRPVGAGVRPVFDQAGPEEWVIDGKTYEIGSTYYLQLDEGYQYTIEYPYEFGAGPVDMDHERAVEVVFPLMRHAYEEGLYDRNTVVKLGQGRLRPTRIGVALVESRGRTVRGYRVGLGLEEIERRIERSAEAK